MAQFSTSSESLRRIPHLAVRDKFRGCLLGGAVGDALGAPVEFMSLDQILNRFGPVGITDYAEAFGKVGAITDDTQLTLFSAEGVLRAYVRASIKGICDIPSVIANAYLRWLDTQKPYNPATLKDSHSWLMRQPELYSLRAPGITCLEALSIRASGKDGGNNSKGCGGVMRVAPIGMLMASLALRNPAQNQSHLNTAFTVGCESASITHGHPTGILSSGVFSAILYLLLLDETLNSAIDQTVVILKTQDHHQETLIAIEKAVQLASKNTPHQIAIKELGEGWVAEEALAISLFCALTAKDLENGIQIAVNHDGDSDSTGSMTGQLLGAILGESSIPSRWVSKLELRTVIEEVADDLATAPDWDLDEYSQSKEGAYYWTKYPGG